MHFPLPSPLPFALTTWFYILIKGPQGIKIYSKLLSGLVIDIDQVRQEFLTIPSSIIWFASISLVYVPLLHRWFPFASII